MKITKKNTENFDSVLIHFFDSCYTVKAEFISDFCFEAEKQKRSERLLVKDGFIEFDDNALETKGLLDDNYMPDEYRITGELLSRLKEGADVYLIDILSKGKNLRLELPCKPLTCGDRIIEYSNCPYFDGKRRIYAGQSSKNPQRDDVIYSDVCKNWDKLFKDYKPDILYGEIINIKIDGDGLGLEFEVLNKCCPVAYFEFWFKDIVYHKFDMHLPGSLYDVIKIEKMANGHIFFRFKDGEICLECGEVGVYISI